MEVPSNLHAVGQFERDYEKKFPVVPNKFIRYDEVKTFLDYLKCDNTFLYKVIDNTFFCLKNLLSSFFY